MVFFSDWLNRSAIGRLLPMPLMGRRCRQADEGSASATGGKLSSANCAVVSSDFVHSFPSSACRHLLPVEETGRRRIIAGVTAVLLAAILPSPALAACPQELSIYEDTSGNSLTFVPPHNSQAAEHEFKLRIGTTELQGVVMWSKDPDRPNGILMDKCPDGDVTGEELNACTVWQGVIYGLTKDAAAPFIGKRGSPHAEALLLPDLSRYAMDHAYKTPLAGPPKVDDVFRMKACQE